MSDPTHFLVVTYPSWAHVRTLVALANSLLHVNPDLHVTILIPSKRSQAVALELKQYDNPTGDRIRLLHYGDDEQRDVGGMWNPRGGFRDECIAQLDPITDAIVKHEAITDPITGDKVTPFDIPYTLILTDITLVAWAAKVKGVVKELTGFTPPLVSSAPYNSAFLSFFLTVGGEFHDRVTRIVEEGGEDEDKIEKLKQQYITNNSDLCNIPTLWPFYFYESCPVSKESVLQYAYRVAPMLKFLGAMIDGYTVAWPKALGEPLQASMDKEFGTVYQVGPQLPPSIQDEWSVEGRKGACKDYLDASPAQSVVYISFGSVLFAPSHDQIRILLDVLDEIGARYILAEGNAPTETKEMMRARVGKGKDQGLLVAWAPQRAILSHKSTKVFLTHGGSNSAMESMSYKVPMLQWPAGFDQPYIANELDRLGVARELLQIRDGFNIGKEVARNGAVVHGTEEALRSEFLEVLGPESDALMAKLRVRVEEVGDLLKSDRESGGSAEAVRALAYFHK